MAQRKSTEEKQADNLAMVREKIASWPDPYPEVGAALHEIAARFGQPRLWYGGCGYAASISSPVLVFFRVDEDVMSIGVTEDTQPTETQLVDAAWFLRAETPELADETLARFTDIVRHAFDKKD